MLGHSTARLTKLEQGLLQFRQIGESKIVEVLEMALINEEFIR